MTDAAFIGVMTRFPIILRICGGCSFEVWPKRCGIRARERLVTQRQRLDVMLHSRERERLSLAAHMMP